MVRNDALRVVRSRVTGNVAGGNGGGLVSYTVSTPTASMYVADSAIDKNQASGSGGGIYTYRISTSTITRSSLHTNMANWGGAISARETMSLAVIDSTLSGNHAVTSGGAVIAQRSGVSFHRSTITGNSAASNPDGTGAGGGIIAYDGSKISLGHTILAGNHDPSNLGPDLYLYPNFNAPTLSATFSLIGDNRGTNQAGGARGLAQRRGKSHRRPDEWRDRSAARPANIQWRAGVARWQPDAHARACARQPGNRCGRSGSHARNRASCRCTISAACRFPVSSMATAWTAPDRYGRLRTAGVRAVSLIRRHTRGRARRRLFERRLFVARSNRNRQPQSGS